MITYFLYDNNGDYQGCTLHVNEHLDLNYTTAEPPVYDEFTEKLKFIDGAWQIELL